MSRFGRIRRRPDHWTSPHERARVRAAERLDGPIGLAESTFLEGHLAECRACAAVAAAYDADRQGLRALRGAEPEPPRDLWARTAAAIERESSARGRSSTTPRATRRLPLGALSGVAVIAVVVGVSAVSTGIIPSFGGAAGEAATRSTADMPGAASPQTDTSESYVAGGAPGPTPFAVLAGDVAWVQSSAGRLAYNNTPIDEVCPDGVDCALLDAATSRLTDIAPQPKAIISAPNDDQFVVVSRQQDGGQEITVMDLRDEDGQDPGASPSPEPIAETAAPATAETSSPPPASGGSAASQAPTEPPASEAPTASPAATPSSDGGQGASPSPSASISPEPTAAARLAIAAGVTVVGESAAFSPDGAYFAFTARAADGSSGPNVYLWSVQSGGDVEPLTEDGVSTFASWAGDNILISRPADADLTAEATEATPETIVVDPASGDILGSAEAWRPAVDPTGRRAIAWVGSIRRSDGDDQAWQPLEGGLELRAWPITGTEIDQQSSRRERVSSKAVADFDVRWDESGEWVAIWTADDADEGFGRLSLYRVDAETNSLDQPKGAPKDVPALPGFSIGEGRLAWATPRGQGGEGSRVQIVAWNADGVGTVETGPGEDIVIIR